MINELFDLSSALDSIQVQAQGWHRKYKPIPNIRPDAPCVRITVSDGKIVDVSLISAELGRSLRKYGSNQGSYPCMNLAPLYRIDDEATKKELAALSKCPEKIDDACLCKMKSWRTKNNWTQKFLGKYKVSMVKIPDELSQTAVQYPLLQTLLAETKRFVSPSVLHAELEQFAWGMLERRERVSLALKVLFFQGKKDKTAEDDYGSLSVAFDSEKLIGEGTPAVSERFVHEFNEHLMRIDDDDNMRCDADSIDAFGIPFHMIEEPMPSVKLDGGFDVTLRTMFKEQRCQSRYGKIENASYPISPQMRRRLQSALTWIGDSQLKDKTWMNTNAKEILFVCPSVIPKAPSPYATLFGRSVNDETTFSKKAEKIIHDLQQAKELGTDTYPKRITIFVLRKIDKARTKIVYTRQTDPYELEKYSEEWTVGCTNLPSFPFGMPAVPYPLDVADTLNRFLDQKGITKSNKFKLYPQYHGIEMLMDPALSVTTDLHQLAVHAMQIGASLGNLCAKYNLENAAFKNGKDMLSLMGLLLYREHIGKDHYMDNLPYLYGQLLKAADELHALYCRVVRGEDYPPQFVGSSLFQSAAETPVRTMMLLSQRMMPYYAWAKSYRLNGQEESWCAGWLYAMCEKIMSRLQNSWASKTRFTDEEKVQFFIGYLAKFPQKEEVKSTTEEESENE